MQSVQLRMARSALALSVREAAALAAVSPDTIVSIEAGRSVKATTLAKVQAALEAAGVIFIDENGEGPGVRLKKV